MVEGHRVGEHVFQTGILQPSGDLEEEIEFREHGGLMVRVLRFLAKILKFKDRPRSLVDPLLAAGG
jgi:hypothetical protein